MSNSLRPRVLQYARLPCPSLSPCSLKFMSIESVMPSSHLILCHPLLLLSSVLPSVRVFSSELAHRIGWPKHSNFSFSISSSNEYSGLMSFMTDWLDLPAIRGTHMSLQHHSLKASVLQHSAFFMVQLMSIRDYWKNHSLDYTDPCWQSDVSAF